ncbi:MAG: type II toxin-antitoxin system mRNA interferase toxin, RelE/StbE family [Bacteriovorax sp.]|nr:type II toxin-antitoxin system mRNA interferase toxin, RelE/StbE family [Bacteriovorax sp.]
MNRVIFDKAKKDIDKLPSYITRKLLKWAEEVEMSGIREIRKYSGYHDEPLKGFRNGQRSIRLSASYRAIYTERASGEIDLIIVIEVNKHKY